MPRCRRRLVSLAKNPSTALSQDADVGVKWKVQRGWRANHSLTFGCLWVAELSTMAWIRLALGGLRFDGVEETNELLVPMAFHVASDDSAVEDIECSKQRGGSMTFVVVGHCPGAAGLHRQARLGTVEGLDLALLVNGEDDRVGRRIDIKTDDVLEFLCKLRVIRQLEGAQPVRCRLLGVEDALHRPQAPPRRLGQHATGPMGRRAGRRPKRKVYHPPYGRGRQRVRFRPLRPCTRQPRDAFRHEPGLPAPYHGL